MPTEFSNIQPENIVFVYNTNVSGSQEVAEYYRDAREIPPQNLIGLDMPVPDSSLGCESPITKSQFMDTIYNPLLDAIYSPYIALGGSSMELNATIILGFGTPLSYTEDDNNVIAIASRLHRLGHSYNPKQPNHTYDRRGNWKFFDTEDSTEILIVAVLDGPTAQSVMTLIDRSIDVSYQTFIPGKIYVDPYGKKITTEQMDYQADILDFINNESSNLGMETISTIDTNDTNTEPTINEFSGDSFYWGWYEPTYSQNLFRDGNERRVFLYNADDTSACNVHYYQNGSPFDPNGSDPWCNLAINISPGYAATAGSVGGEDEYGFNLVGEENYLRPIPFFESLHRGSTLGEAFLFASPYVCWKTILIGDPLMSVKFIGNIPSDQDISIVTPLIPNNEVIRRVKESLEESLAFGHRQSRLLDEIITTNINSENFAEELYLLYALSEWKNARSSDVYDNAIARGINAWSTYILQTTGLTVAQWMSRQREKTSKLMDSLLNLPTSQVQNIGHWEYDFIFQYGRFNFEPVHFRIQVSTDTDFTNVVIDANSFDDESGWKYEQNPYIFTQISSSGLPSNFHGRTIKYISPVENYLTHTELYYIRTKTLESDGVTDITDYIASPTSIIIKY